MDTGIRRILISQAVITTAVACGYAVYQGRFAAISATYGGSVTLLSSWWMARSARRASLLAPRDPQGGSLALFGGMAQKYLFAIVALVVSLAVLKLSPLAVLVGFAVTHVGFLFAGQGTTR